MAKIIPITEHFQHFVAELKESFWGDLQGEAQRAAKKFFELLSERQRDRYMVNPRYRRSPARKDHRNGYYLRDFVTRFGTLRLRIARSRKRGFLPAVIAKFQRRADEVCLLIREAFLRGISTRQVGRVVGLLTGEVVSAQTVSQLTRDLDQAVRQFHQAPLEDEWAYLFLDGVSLRVRRPSGRQRVQMLVAYGVRRDGTRQLLAFLRSSGESQSAWEGLLEDLYRRGLRGENLLLIVTDGCAGLAAAIPTVYPRVLHQRCWVHKMRNILEHVRKRDYDDVKRDAQAIYGAESRRHAEACLSCLSPPVAAPLRSHGAAPGARSAGVALVLQLPSTSVEETAHHQHYRALLCRGAPPHPTHGLLCQRSQCGPDHLLHFPEIQPGMEKPHPPAIYTSSLTSPLSPSPV